MTQCKHLISNSYITASKLNERAVLNNILKSLGCVLFSRLMTIRRHHRHLDQHTLEVQVTDSSDEDMLYG